MEWKNVQKDFIERTLRILKQYDKFVKSERKSNKDFEELEVTLLVNCLSGLLVFPYEYTNRDQEPGSVPICMSDTIKIKDLDNKWGLQNANIEFISDFNHKKVEPSTEASLRTFIYRMRNSVSHSRFYDATKSKTDGVGIIYEPTTYDNTKSKIVSLIFQDINSRFKIIISPESLRQFAETFANEVLNYDTTA